MPTHKASNSDFAMTGWCCSAYDQDLVDWVESVLPLAYRIISDPHHGHWWRHGNTWFAGVNILPNDSEGRVEGGGVLSKNIQLWLRASLQLPNSYKFTWERGQLSVLKPGYPKRDVNETEAAYKFRYKRDAAHVDGLLPVGTARRRMPQEFHHFILGIPLQHTPAYAGSTVVWEGSHRIMQHALTEALRDIPEQDWPSTDLTEIYQHARREVFACCKRVEVHVPPGHAYLIHRLAVHGVAPWQERAGEQSKLRSIVFFRPEVNSKWEWLTGF